MQVLQQMMDTKLILMNGVSYVPLDPTNRDYQKIQEWVAIDGNNITDP